MALSCSQPVEIVEFADQVWFQSRQVTTDVISVEEGMGLENVDFGWRAVPAAGRASHLGAVAKIPRLSFFSADGDATALELELRRSGETSPGRMRVRVRLNGQKIKSVRPGGEWTVHRLELPSGSVRLGDNLLELQLRGRGSKATGGHGVDLRRLRIHSAAGRGLWLERPEAIVVGSTNRDARPDRIRLPNASWLEAFVELSESARLEGSFALRKSPGDASTPLVLYATLVDGQDETEIFTRELVGGDQAGRAGEMSVDLGEWAGRQIVIRLGVRGPGNGVVEWRNAQIDGARDILADSIPLLSRETSLRSGRLGRPNVIMILLDAARADAFSSFGGAWKTPAAERLAAGGTVFSEAFSASSWTGQSVAATMTGLFPDSIGAGPWGSVLPDGIPTLAELMSRNGYRTIGWSHHPFYGLQRSLRRGFDEFHQVRSRPYKVPEVADLLGSREAPTFAFVHLMPPHAPYDPPDPFRGLYSSGYGGQMSVEASALNKFSRGTDTADAGDLAYVRERYQENVAYADSLVDKLLNGLEAAGAFDDSLVILLSDHGEAFFEHGEFLHTKSLYREAIHVPLILKWPAAMEGYRQRVEEAVSLVDLVPTLVDGLALADDGPGYQGRSLLPPVFEGVPAVGGVYAVTRGVASKGRAPRVWRSLQTAGWKLARYGLDDTSLLFDVGSDPLETEDLAATEAMRTRLYRKAVSRQAEYNRQVSSLLALVAPDEDMPEEIRDQLEALGYLQ